MRTRFAVTEEVAFWSPNITTLNRASQKKENKNKNKNHWTRHSPIIISALIHTRVVDEISARNKQTSRSGIADAKEALELSGWPMERFENALSKHRTANPKFARVYEEYIDDMLPSASVWPDHHRWHLLLPPCEDLILFLLQNGASPSHLTDLMAAYSEVELPTKARQRLQMLLFRYEPAFCIEDGTVQYGAGSFMPISACTCAPCTVAAGCDNDNSKLHVDATRRQIERKFKLENRAYDMYSREVRRLDGRSVA